MSFSSYVIAGNRVQLVSAPNRRAQCMQCPRPRPAATHIGLINGTALASGCEWHMRLWLREQIAIFGGPQSSSPAATTVEIAWPDIACAAPGEVCEQPRRSRFRLTPIRNGAADA